MNLDYATVFSLASYMNENLVTIIGICILIGAMAKSSQVGRRKLKALKNKILFFRTLIYAGIASNALESVGTLMLYKNNPLLFNYTNINYFSRKSKTRARYYSTYKKCNDTGLEVWGMNLRSTVGIRFTYKELQIITFPNHIKGIMVGLILSDGYLSKSPNSKNASLRFKQSLGHFKYLWFVFNSLSHYCPTNPKLGIGRRGETKVYDLLIYTRSMSCITELYNIFYLDKIKVIPDNIYELLTPIALAHFIMGDGTRTGNGLIICTHNFSVQEVVKLINVLMIKYRFICTLRMNWGKPTIYISSKSLDLLRATVIPYMEPSMLYKIGLDIHSREKYLSKQYTTKLNYSTTQKHFGPEESQGQGANQQGISELADSDLKKFSGKFLEWFIGFSEGDGSFVVTGGNSVFSIYLHIVDLPLLYKIQTELNMGNVYFKDNSATLIIKAKKDVATLIKIFNGNIFLYKRKIQFAKWLDNYNLKNKTSIKLKQNEFCPTLNHGWLSGFVDAEGSFFVSVSTNRVVQRFSIAQKDAEPEFFYLKDLLNGNYELWKNYSRIVVNFYALDIIINYLSKYELHSVKAKSLKKWLEIYDYRKNKSSIEKVDYVQLKKKASLINQLRKIPKI